MAISCSFDIVATLSQIYLGSFYLSSLNTESCPFRVQSRANWSIYPLSVMWQAGFKVSLTGNYFVILLAYWKIAIWNTKFCLILPPKYEHFATFCHKNRPILLIKCTNWRTFYRSRRPGLFHWSKSHTKSHSGAYQKENWLKKSI